MSTSVSSFLEEGQHNQTPLVYNHGIEPSLLPVVESCVLLTGAAAFFWPDRGGPPRERAVSAGLAAALALGTWPYLRNLRVADLNACYPYMTPDSYDWIANGLFWAGEPLTSSFRPPGLPLVIAALHRLGALPALPALGVGVLLVTTAMLYRLLRRAHGPEIAAAAAVIAYSNAYILDSARHVMAETWATALLVAAASRFVLALDEPRHYRSFGLLLGSGFLFHYTALPAGVGCAAAVLLARREHLRSRFLWQGAALAAVLPAAWLVFRQLQYQRPGAPIHVIEGLLTLGVRNVRFYLVAGAALLGLVLLPLYAAGALRLIVNPARARHPVNVTAVAFLAGLAVHWLFLYDFVAKRFLVYLFPFALILLAEGLEALWDYARHNRVTAAVSGVYLAAALLWNQIQYPSWQIGYLAITPRDFLDAALHIDGAEVHRVHVSWLDGLERGLFDFTRRPLPCDLAEPRVASLSALRTTIDGMLKPGEPLGFEPRELGAPELAWARLNQVGNTLLRPVVRADLAEIVLSEADAPAGEVIEIREPYTLLRRSSQNHPAARTYP